MKFLFDGDGVLGVERWLGAGSFLDEVSFSVKACSLRQWRLENLSDSRGFESGLRVVLPSVCSLGQAVEDLVEGCVRFSCGSGLASYLGLGVRPLFIGVNSDVGSLCRLRRGMMVRMRRVENPLKVQWIDLVGIEGQSLCSSQIVLIVDELSLVLGVYVMFNLWLRVVHVTSLVLGSGRRLKVASYGGVGGTARQWNDRCAPNLFSGARCRTKPALMWVVTSSIGFGETCLRQEWFVAVFEESLMRAFSYGVCSYWGFSSIRWPLLTLEDFGAYTLSRGVIELTIVNLVSSLTARVEIRFLVASLG
ncbi:hypothetical protein YC2023_011331 [Brassica napus]